MIVFKKRSDISSLASSTAVMPAPSRASVGTVKDDATVRNHRSVIKQLIQTSHHIDFENITPTPFEKMTLNGSDSLPSKIG